jgi:sec-independent protein translocase protein TatA
MPNIGPTELIIVLIIALVILGPKRLPSAGRSLGQGLREFRDGIAGRGDARAEIPAPQDRGSDPPS